MIKQALAACLVVYSFTSIAQEETQDLGTITGNFETTFQYLNEDSLIDAFQPAQKGLLNSYMNIFYTRGNFRAGLRAESYLPRIQGYPTNFDGTGIGMAYAGYGNDFIDITVGSIYEQFGTGLALRTYENRTLGYDNLLNGARVIFAPYKGIKLKGIYGLQRNSFLEGRVVHSGGIVRGADAEVHLNQTFTKMASSKIDVTAGLTFVSKYQVDDNSKLILPENVGSYGGRLNLRYNKFTLGGEFIQKEQDPSSDNGNIYNYGHAMVINAGYSQKGLGIMFSAKSVDNMSYRSNRNEKLQNSLINYLPAMNKTHTYNLVASLYPYATQPLGEIAYQGEVLYTIKKGSKLGGKYGTSINVNSSIAMVPNRDYSNINPFDSTGIAYETGVFDHAKLTDSSNKYYWNSEDFLWHDFNINIYRKFSKNFNLTLSYFNIKLNNTMVQAGKETGAIRTNIFVAEAGINFKNKSSLRVELQGLFVNRRDSITGSNVDANGKKIRMGSENAQAVDKGDWVTLLVEYTINSHWYVAIMNQYNLGNGRLSHHYAGQYFGNNPVHIFSETEIHHPYISAGYIQGPTRVTVSYGRQREGLFCVGGVCRQVPASNGLTISITHSF